MVLKTAGAAGVQLHTIGINGDCSILGETTKQLLAVPFITSISTEKPMKFLNAILTMEKLTFDVSNWLLCYV